LPDWIICLQRESERETERERDRERGAQRDRERDRDSRTDGGGERKTDRKTIMTDKEGNYLSEGFDPFHLNGFKLIKMLSCCCNK
jgi:hypothetical protein